MITDKDEYYRVNKYIDFIFDHTTWSVYNYIESTIDKIIDFYQLHTRGFATSEIYSFPIVTANWILPRLKYYRNNFTGVPFNCEDPNSNTTLTADEWRERLDKIIYAFEFIIKEDDIMEECYPKDFNWGFHSEKTDNSCAVELIFNDSRQPDYTHYNECVKKHEEGMKLYCLYFRSIWD